MLSQEQNTIHRDTMGPGLSRTAMRGSSITAPLMTSTQICSFTTKSAVALFGESTLQCYKPTKISTLQIMSTDMHHEGWQQAETNCEEKKQPLKNGKHHARTNKYGERQT